MESVEDHESYSIFEEPQVHPRVGNEYQAEIPPLIAKLDRFEIANKLKLSSSCSWGVVPIISKNCEVENFDGKVESRGNEDISVALSNEIAEIEVKPLNDVLGDAKDDGEEISNSKVKSWSKIEEESFLLGLYIFGKNLRLVKRFVGSKETGDILSFYYGKFYTSDGYRRWSECRKLKGRRCIHGQKIFTGWRQKELQSRLLPHVSKECQDMLMESLKHFVDGRVSFEEYIFKLKETVGIDLLIESVGVGKGKQDLTGTALEPTKNNHNNNVTAFRAEVSIGKAYSSFTSAEIIKFLRGNFRLSKARKSELFWEAVWPRLLARGWHSEQPRSSLVFLVPGISEFSRTLVKGNEYFDSLCDVLDNVASDPGVLEIDNDSAKASEDREDREDREVDLQSMQQLHYLIPRRVNGKFTVVDTSMVLVAQQPNKVRELRSLPVQTASLSAPSNLFSETELDTSQDSEAEETNVLNPKEDMIDIDSSDCVTSNLKDGSSSKLKSCHELKLKGLMPSGCEAMECQVDDQQPLSRMEKGSPSRSNEGSVAQNFEALHDKSQSWEWFDLNLPPPDLETDEPEKEEDMVMPNEENSSVNKSAFDFEPPKEDIVVENEENSSVNKSAFDFEPPKEGIVVENEENSSVNKSGIDTEPEMEDIVVENEENSTVNKSAFESEPAKEDMVVENSENLSVDKSEFESEPLKEDTEPEPVKIPEVEDSVEEEQPVIKSQSQSQRHSTRNRPLTTKAWEALEFDFFRTNRKRRGEALQNKSSRAQRARGSTIVGEHSIQSVGANIGDSRLGEENRVMICRSNSNTVGVPQV